MSEIELEIIRILGIIRPYLRREGGDIEYIRYEDGIVYVRMLGACVDCSGLESTLYDGVLTLLTENIPEVIDVRNVEGEVSDDE